MTYKLLHCLFEELKISRRIQEHFRKMPVSVTETINVMRVGEDIILADGPVEKHTDNTVSGKDTIMLVLVADGGIQFDYPCCSISLRTGDIIRFNGNEQHALTRLNKDCKFCAIIWDINLKTSINDLISDFVNRLKELDLEIKNTK